MGNIQTFGDVVPSRSESKFDGESINVEDLVGHTFAILDCSVIPADNPEDPTSFERADFQVDFDGNKRTFVTASLALVKSAKTIVEKKILSGGVIETKLTEKDSKKSKYSYFQFT